MSILFWICLFTISFGLGLDRILTRKERMRIKQEKKVNETIIAIMHKHGFSGKNGVYKNNPKKPEA
jgi:uncharacterized membrane protein